MTRLGDSEEDDRQIRDDAEAHRNSADAAVARDAKIAEALEHLLSVTTALLDPNWAHVQAAIEALQDIGRMKPHLTRNRGPGIPH